MDRPTESDAEATAAATVARVLREEAAAVAEFAERAGSCAAAAVLIHETTGPLIVSASASRAMSDARSPRPSPRSASPLSSSTRPRRATATSGSSSRARPRSSCRIPARRRSCRTRSTIAGSMASPSSGSRAGRAARSRGRARRDRLWPRAGGLPQPARAHHLDDADARHRRRARGGGVRTHGRRARGLPALPSRRASRRAAPDRGAGDADGRGAAARAARMPR
jgi:hypothetical protein